MVNSYFPTSSSSYDILMNWEHNNSKVIPTSAHTTRQFHLPYHTLCFTTWFLVPWELFIMIVIHSIRNELFIICRCLLPINKQLFRLQMPVAKFLSHQNAKFESYEQSNNSSTFIFFWLKEKKSSKVPRLSSTKMKGWNFIPNNSWLLGVTKSAWTHQTLMEPGSVTKAFRWIDRSSRRNSSWLTTMLTAGMKCVHWLTCLLGFFGGILNPHAGGY